MQQNLISLFDKIQVPDGCQPPEVQRFLISRDARNCVFQHPPSLFWWPGMRLPRAAHLEFAVGSSPVSWEQMDGEHELKLWILAEGGEPEEIFSITQNPRKNMAHRMWTECKVDLAEFGGQDVRIGFQTRTVSGGSSYAWLGWAEPLLVSEALDVAHDLAPAQMPKPKHPHIVLVTADALRRDHLSCYGSTQVQTPWIDSLGEEGIRFVHARSNSDTTLASQISLLTGRLPDETGVVAEWGEFPVHLPNLVNILKAQGYQTALVSGELEFTAEDQPLAGLFDRFVRCVVNPAQNSAISIGRALALLDELDWSQPQFIWVQFFDPHPPSLPDKSLAAEFYLSDPADPANKHHPELVARVHAIESSLELTGCMKGLRQGEIPFSLIQRLEDTVRALTGEISSGPDLSFHLPGLFPAGYGKRGFSQLVEWLGAETTALRAGSVSAELVNFLEELLKRLHISESHLLGWLKDVVDSRYPEAMYAATIKGLDLSLGRLWDALRERDLWEETCVVFISPHGECLCEEGLNFEHHSPVETVLRVPLLIKPAAGCGIPPGTSLEEPAELLNVAGWVLDLCELDGGDLLNGKSRCKIGEAGNNNKTSMEPALAVGMQGLSCVIYEHPWKLLICFEDGLPWLDGRRLNKGEYLFDCSTPDGELQDVTATNGAIVARLRAAFEAWQPEPRITSRPLEVKDSAPLVPGFIPPLRRDKGQSQQEADHCESLNAEEALDMTLAVNRAFKLATSFSKERDYAVKKLHQIREAQSRLYTSSRWRFANLFLLFSKEKQTGYPPVDKLFQTFDEWMSTKYTHGQGVLLDSKGYMDFLVQSRPSEETLTGQIRSLSKNPPEFRIFTDGENLDLVKQLESQPYPHWELITPSGHSGNPGNAEGGPGSLWFYIRPGDRLEPHSLVEFAKAAVDHPDAPFIFADEGRVNAAGDIFDDPFFKPDWSPELMESMDAVGRAVVFSGEAVAGLPGSRDWIASGRHYRAALALGHQSPTPPFHIHKLLLHACRNPTGKATENLVPALEAEFKRRDEAVWIKPLPEFDLVRVQRQIAIRRSVTIVIPTRDRLELLSRCIESIVTRTSYENYEILILDNGSTDPKTLQYLENCGHRVLRIDGPFNYAAMHNHAVEQVNTDWLIFLNNDTEVRDVEWIEALAEYGQLPDIGAVGMRLLYPNGRIQHAGVVLGSVMKASHAFANCRADDRRGHTQLHTVRNYSAVTAACMFTRREVFQKMGGFDDVRFKIAYNDVDYCMRLWKNGYRVVSTPHASMFHHESASRPKLEMPEEVAALREMYLSDATWTDPFYHPLLRRSLPDFSLNTLF